MTKLPSVAIVRGKFLNEWELQNFEPLRKQFRLVGFASKKPLSKPEWLKVIHLFSPLDLLSFPKKMGILNRLFVDAHLLLGLEKYLRGFTIAHTAETYFHFTRQVLVAKQKGWIKKVVVTCWETIPFNNEGIWGRKRFKQKAIAEADWFLTPTYRACNALVKEGCPRERITIVRMGVDLSRFCPKEHQQEDQNEAKILFVGRLVAEKGVWELIESFVRLYQEDPQWRLVLIGEGPEKGKIQRYFQNLNLSSVITIKRVAYQQIHREYQQADIFVLPSKPTKFWEEQYGMAVVEAMACGLPVVVSNCGALSEVVGAAGILTKPGETDKLYQALKCLLKDKQQRKRFGWLARQRAKRVFDREKTAVKIGQIYEKIIAGK